MLAYYHAYAKGVFNIISDTNETYLATIDQAYLKILIIRPS